MASVFWDDSARISTRTDKGVVTGDCFRKAYTYLMALRDSGNAEACWLVRGIVSRNSRDCEGAHAWVELKSEEVVDESNRNCIHMHKRDYCACYGIVPACRYTAKDALMENLRSCHCGPWGHLCMVTQRTAKP